MDENLKPRTLPWKCESCGARLGLLDAGRNVLTIKVKDAYIWIRDGDVSMTCRQCGSINTLEQEIGQKDLPDRSTSESASDKRTDGTKEGEE